MKKLFTIASLLIFMISLTSFSPVEIGGYKPIKGEVSLNKSNLNTEIGGYKPIKGE